MQTGRQGGVQNGLDRYLRPEEQRVASNRSSREDPRALMLTILCFFLSDLIFLFVLLVVVQAFVIMTGVSPRTYSHTLWLAAKIGTDIHHTLAVFDQAGEPMLLDLWIYKVTLPGLLRSLAVAIRIFLIASGWFILIFTTSHSQLVRGLVKLAFVTISGFRYR